MKIAYLTGMVTSHVKPGGYVHVTQVADNLFARGMEKTVERNGFRVTMIPAAFYKNNRFFPPQHWKIYLRKL